MKTLGARLRRHIEDLGPGAILTTAGLIELGFFPRSALDQALYRLRGEGALRRLAAGVFMKPNVHPIFGELEPNADALASALAAKNGVMNVLPAGSILLNELGLSEQVPASRKYVYGGRTKCVKIDGREIELRHASARRTESAKSNAGAVIEALRALGRAHVNASVRERLIRVLSDDDKRELGRVFHRAPGWAQPLLREVSKSL